jgi:hypothetical protein
VEDHEGVSASEAHRNVVHRGIRRAAAAKHYWLIDPRDSTLTVHR